MLYLIRHAKSVYNPNITDSERPLSIEGQEQAQALIAVLQKFQIRKIYSSPMNRAVETVTPFAKEIGLKVETEGDLRERKTLPAKSIEDYKAILKQSWADMHFKPKGWESYAECKSRFINKIEELFFDNSDYNIAISSHGQAISLFLNKIDPTFGFEDCWAMPMPAVIKISYKTGEFVWDGRYTTV